MPPGSEYALIILGVLILAFIGLGYFILSSTNKNNKNRLRKQMVIELLESNPNMSQKEILDLVDETIQ